jgi:hypothetical protein
MLMLAAVAVAAAPPATPPPATNDTQALRAEIMAARDRLDAQQKSLDAERQRLRDLEARLDAKLGPAPAPAPAAAPQPTQQASAAPVAPPADAAPLTPSLPDRAPAAGSGAVQTVGEAPTDQRQVQVAVLPSQGGIITRKGRLTLEGDVEYSHAENNSVIFRGIGVDAAVLIGVFDINKSRQDVVTTAGVARYGLTDRLELNGRLPFVYRSDRTVLAPVSDPSTPNAGQLNRPVTDANLGDVEFGARYQLTNGRDGAPYLIAGVQAIAPTGRGPFSVPYDSLGNGLKAATGSGFWGITPNVTAILPTDPAVLFATLGYTFNLGRSYNTTIGPAHVDHVQPGDEPNASFGVAISLNPRTAISLGYAHTMAFGSKTKLRAIDATTGALGPVSFSKTRSLQLGRLLFGVSYRVSPVTTINWAVEAGVTDDAPDVRATLRIPINFDTGR